MRSKNIDVSAVTSVFSGGGHKFAAGCVLKGSVQECVKKLIDESNNIVFFGGAGTSTECGIPDFRSADGLYSKKKYGYEPEVIISHDFFYFFKYIFLIFQRKRFFCLYS